MDKLFSSLSLNFGPDGADANQTLTEFLQRLKIPLIAQLEDSESYLQADAEGKGIFELKDAAAVQQQIRWQPLLEWLDSRRSIPIAKKN